MSETAPTSAPAAAPAASSSGTPEPSAQPAKAPSKLKIANYEFNSEDDAKAEIERGRQSGKLLTEAQKRLFEASKRDKEWNELVGEIKNKKDAKKAIEKLGLSREEAVEIFGRWLYENEVLPKEMSPEQRRIKELEAEKAKWQEESTKKERAAKEEEENRLAQQEAVKLRAELEKVLEAKKVPNTRLAVRRLANYLSQYADAGAEIPVERAADLVMEDYKQEFGELFDDASPDQLAEFFGKQRWMKIAKKVSQWALKGSRPPQQDVVPPDMAVPPRNAAASNGKASISPTEFLKSLRTNK